MIIQIYCSLWNAPKTTMKSTMIHQIVLRVNAPHSSRIHKSYTEYGRLLCQSPVFYYVFFVVPPGLEPGQAEPKSDVLPLHHGTILLVLSVKF